MDNDEWAEIIPCEPDAVSTDEGIVTSCLYILRLKSNSLYLHTNS